MKSAASFTFSQSKRGLPFVFDMEMGEELIGWYRNPPPFEQPLIFTTHAIYGIEAGHVIKILWPDIFDYELPAAEGDFSGVKIRARTGAHFLRMAGGYGIEGKGKDVFDFIEVLKVLAKRSDKPVGRRERVLSTPIPELDEISLEVLNHKLH